MYYLLFYFEILAFSTKMFWTENLSWKKLLNMYVPGRAIYCLWALAL